MTSFIECNNAILTTDRDFRVGEPQGKSWGKHLRCCYKWA